MLLEAVVGLMMVRVAMKVMPFRRLARRFGTFAPPNDLRVAQGLAQLSPAHRRLAIDIGWAVTRAARYVPFRAVCLPQAIAAQAMLRRRGVKSVMHFGAARAEDSWFDYHAWLDAGGVQITGYPVALQFTEIACFV